MIESGNTVTAHRTVFASSRPKIVSSDERRNLLSKLTSATISFEINNAIEMILRSVKFDIFFCDDAWIAEAEIEEQKKKAGDGNVGNDPVLVSHTVLKAFTCEYH